ncbi:MAG: acetyl-CoA carboxylase biotin carboxyl carrier protein [Geminocystis sp.]|nr:acetyl-CoA carboxylase biotin carboxyl carrier protein [Geminocystis sp.]HIK38582.1 acetyl-CoA carboxylase biotin carboxyl carrier protein [Geminocystis sp. M7585_C2015_104]MCS7147329.1 acetyl-CoA carboxylase biotin carboxyl carrier protein [Geminocystis sp.]MCX8079089.1 acetyl-CoA carboxylase biotin carboxyl carrier protein [Geminocystis sp.]MDW8116328.1 acetyl-CoA carboxylase biotin carboxyl carrier protein [Geminocystis sp.]
MPIDFNQLREFIEAIAKTDISELALKEGDFELTIHKAPPVPAPIPSKVESTVSPTPPVTPPPGPVLETPAVEGEKITSGTKTRENWVEITSPMVGTFYRAPAPGEPPFVEVGDIVSPGQVVCIIEAMKLMNEIEAEVGGRVMEIVVENGQPVEYGQTLMWIAPQP